MSVIIHDRNAHKSKAKYMKDPSFVKLFKSDSKCAGFWWGLYYLVILAIQPIAQHSHNLKVPVRPAFVPPTALRCLIHHGHTTFLPGSALVDIFSVVFVWKTFKHLPCVLSKHLCSAASLPPKQLYNNTPWHVLWCIEWDCLVLWSQQNIPKVPEMREGWRLDVRVICVTQCRWDRGGSWRAWSRVVDNDALSGSQKHASKPGQEPKSTSDKYLWILWMQRLLWPFIHINIFLPWSARHISYIYLL